MVISLAFPIYALTILALCHGRGNCRASWRVGLASLVSIRWLNTPIRPKSSGHFAKTSPWVLRFIARFQYTINHGPGKTLYTAHTHYHEHHLKNQLVWQNVFLQKLNSLSKLWQQFSQSVRTVWIGIAELKLQTRFAPNLLNIVSQDVHQETIWVEKRRITWDFMETSPSVATYYCSKLELWYLQVCNK